MTTLTETVLSYETIETPIDAFLLIYEEGDTAAGALVYADFNDQSARRQAHLARRYGSFKLEQRHAAHPLRMRFERYFACDAHAFDALGQDANLSPGGSDTQQRVWTALRSIPTGTTTSYGELAARLGRKGAARAIGRINGQNPLSIIVPCHRVIGANGNLVGYAGGVERKEWLLRHEGAIH